MEHCSASVNFPDGQLCSFHYRLYKAGLPDRERLISPKGTGTFDKKGYIVIVIDGNQYFEHRLIAEKALGKKLPEEAQVHHLNEKKWDNRNENLVVCPNNEYHRLLHKRAKELSIVFT